MIESIKRSKSELFADRELMTSALARAARESLLRHARDGHPVAVSRNGKVAWVSANELLSEFPDEYWPDDGISRPKKENPPVSTGG